MLFSLPEVSQLIIDYRYLILFPIVVFEGPIITVIAGFLASLGQLNLYIAYFIVIFGDLTGDSIYYAIGRFGKEKIISHLGGRFGLSDVRINDLEKHFEGNGGKTMLLGKLSHGVGAAFLVAAGIAKMPFRRFFWYNFLGTLPKSLILIVIGYYYGQAMAKINSYLEFAAIIFLTAGIIFLVFYFYHPRKK